MRRRVNLIVFWIIVFASMALMILIAVRPDLAPSWSGLGEVTLPDQGVERAKTLWDWLQILAIPAFLLGAAWWLGYVWRAAYQRRTEVEQLVASFQQQEAALEAYFTSMTDLLLNGYLREAGKDANVRKIAEARTLAVLRRLDGARKGQVLQFLYDSGLVTNKPVIQLKRADLADAQLRGARLCSSSLWQADLSRADLANANLNSADLWLANLAGARLYGAKLRGAHLGGVNLRGADLRGADLRGANLRKAHLDRANLVNAVVTAQQLSHAASLRQIRLPDGTLLDGAAVTVRRGDE